MKKTGLLIVSLVALLLALQAQMPPQQPPMKLEDVQKALCFVDKPQPVPDKFKPGMEVINAKDTLAMLGFISSDIAEGRETGSRGFRIAAEYAASLLKMWGVAPAGDMPAPSFGRGMMGGGPPSAPAAPIQRSYFQEFILKQTLESQSQATLEVNKSGAVKTRTFQAGVDYPSGFGSAEGGTLSAPVVFIGYGISEPSIGWDELKGINLKGKIALVLTEAPWKDDPNSPFNAKKELKEKYFPFRPQGMPPMMRRRGMGGRFDKMQEIEKLGPAAIVQVQNARKDMDIVNELGPAGRPSDDRAIVGRNRPRYSIPGDTEGRMGGSGSPSLTITREMANFLLEGTGKTVDDLKRQIETTKKPASADIPGARVTLATTAKTQLVRAANVLGVIEGSDPKLKDEVFIVGAHFDGLGMWGEYIYNGADDNGSGAVGVLNIAKAIAASPVKPKRTVLFALWTGEEQGLFGSRYYVSNSVYPIAKTAGGLNYDMISKPYDNASMERTMATYRVPGAEDLVKKARAPWLAQVNLTEGAYVDIVREMNQYVGLDLMLRTSPLGEGGGSSDHNSYVQAKLPFVYYMGGFVAADFHQPSDSVEKVSGELIAKISQHGFLTVYAIADK